MKNSSPTKGFTGTSNSSELFFENQVNTKDAIFSVKQLGDYLGVSPKTVYGWVYRGIIPFKKVGPRLIRFRKQEIDQWILKHQEENSNGD